MTKASIYIFILLIFFLAGFFLGKVINSPSQKVNHTGLVKKPKPLEKYTIENLSNTQISPAKITIKEILNEENEFISYHFEFEYNPNLDTKTFKKTTGQINIPKEDIQFPVILMLRGYIDQELYKTGDGTRNAAGFFAKSGFITVAPDFLGYAGSDKEADNIFEARFQTYVTVLSLIKSLEQINNWDRKNIFIWGHSNGGQIAVTILEILDNDFPTTLWAPVSKPFPYSVLYYTDESEDRGKLIRRELAKLEDDYNTDLYSLELFLNEINSPLQVHQGGNDDAVPKDWSDKFVSKLNILKKDVIYNVYSEADHNMKPDWDTVIERDLEFFQKNMNSN